MVLTLLIIRYLRINNFLLVNVTSYWDSLFVGHCTAEDFIKHFYEFMNRYDFVNQYCLILVWIEQA